MKSAFTIVAMCVIFVLWHSFGGTVSGLVRHSTAPVVFGSDQNLFTLVCLGDSLTAGDGASVDQSYPGWLYRQLQADGYHYRVVNAGVSGNRVGDGLRRLQSDVLLFHPRIAVVELGSNDPGRTSRDVWEAQLGTIVHRLQVQRVQVVLGGLDEPGMGDVYRRIAARFGVPLVWFISDVARRPADWSDAHHPNGQGYRLVMRSFLPAVQPLLRHA